MSAAEHHTLRVLDVKNQESVGRQEQEVDLDFSAVAVRHDDTINAIVADFIENLPQVITAGDSPVCQPCDQQQNDDSQQPGCVCRLENLGHQFDSGPGNVAINGD